MAAAGAGALALMTATQIYLSMWDHGHSFLRMVAWQLASWAFWICGAPWILRLAGRGARLRRAGAARPGADGRSTWWPRAGHRRGASPFVGSARSIPASRLSADRRGSVARCPISSLVDPVVYVLLIVGGRALAASERAWQLQLRESQLESDLSRAQLDALRLEIEPHFLFNTLNSIAALIRLNDNAGGARRCCCG